VTFALAANALGWIGFGPSETGSMIGGNPCVVMEETFGSGKIEAYSMHSSEFTKPTMNQENKCVLLDFAQVNGETYAKVMRPLRGCRPEDLDIHPEWDMRYIAAWGTAGGMTLAYHSGRRAMTEFNAVYGPGPDYELPPDALSFEAVNGEFIMPAHRDVYFCRGLTLPNDRRFHIVMTEPVLASDEISPAQHHHFNLFACPHGLPPAYRDGETKQCNSATGLPPVGCFQFFTTWLSGQKNVWFMDGALPMGDNGTDGAALYVIAQGHIDNSDMQGGRVVPPWGLRLWYTPTLLPVEAGSIGLVAGLPIPQGIQPGIASYTLGGECPPGCTDTWPAEGVTVTSVAPHMHWHGKGISFRVLRREGLKWVEQPLLHQLLHWDSNFQGVRVRQPFKLLPGDRLVINCIYSTLNRTEPLRNGEGYEDEMCMSSILIHPRQKLTSCAQYPGQADPAYPTFENPIVVCGLSDQPLEVAIVRDYDVVPLPEPPNNCQA